MSETIKFTIPNREWSPDQYGATRAQDVAVQAALLATPRGGCQTATVGGYTCTIRGRRVAIKRAS